MRATTCAAVLTAALLASGVCVPAQAVQTQDKSCTDGGGVPWEARVVWGDTYTASDGTRMVQVASAGWSTQAEKTATDWTVSTFGPAGNLLRRAVDTATHDYNKGSSFYTVNPLDAASSPGRTRVVITLGRDGDGHGSCSLTFTEPGRESASSEQGVTTAPQGDLPGWKQTFVENFTAAEVALGAWPGAYGSKWDAYPDSYRDTSDKGVYSPERTLSVADGKLDIFLHTKAGQPYVAAPQPRLNPGRSASTGQRYGRFSVRFRADRVPGYKTAWLLWPDSDKWPDDGEIDFPEGSLDGKISAFAHHADPDGSQDGYGTDATYEQWHTATTIWAPGRVTFLLDGNVIGSSTTRVPTDPMHWVLQTETEIDGPTPDSASGHVEIDWVTAYTRA